MNDTTTLHTDPDQNATEKDQPMLQEAGLGESASVNEAAIEQIVAEIRADADSQAYAFIP